MLALVGRSGAGKTTAVSVLARHWGYVSDESIGIDEDGRVHPYRKPLSVITSSMGFKEQHSPTDLGLRPLPDRPLHLSRVVLLDRAKQHHQARVIPLSLADALAALAQHSSALAGMPSPLRTVSRLLDHTGGALRVEYGESEDLLDLIQEFWSLEHSSAGLMDAQRQSHSLPTRGGVETVGHALLPGYRKADVVDWHELHDGRLAILKGDPDGSSMLYVLAGFAPFLWRAADGRPRDQLVKTAACLAGLPDQPPACAADNIISHLVVSGLLIMDDSMSNTVPEHAMRGHAV